MIELYGIEFNDDEVDIAEIDGKPEWILSLAGIRRIAKESPNPEKAIAIADAVEKFWLDRKK